MSYDFSDYKVDGKNMILRIVGFVLALIIAVGSITLGVSKLIAKPAGYYEMSAYPNQEDPLYSKGIELHYYLDGSSGAIKEQKKLIENTYSIALERAYKLLNCDTEYDIYKNIAYINNHPGEAVTVNDELLSVLKDAYNKTLEAKGYNMFAGALYRHWQSILILDDVSEFDPVYNSDEKERISNLSSVTEDLANFGLSFEGNAVTFNVSKDYLKYLSDNEESESIIDLNLLHDSYVVTIVVAALEKDGFNNGYIVTDSGIVYNLSEHSKGEFAFYSVESLVEKEGAGEPVPAVIMAGNIPVTKGSCMSGFRNFSTKPGEIMYHVVRDGAKTVWRSPYINTKPEGTFNIYDSVYSISLNGNILSATYQNIIAINTPGEIDKNDNSGDGITTYSFLNNH